jgi:hypothetical protein
VEFNVVEQNGVVFIGKPRNSMMMFLQELPPSGLGLNSIRRAGPDVS